MSLRGLACITAALAVGFLLAGAAAVAVPAGIASEAAQVIVVVVDGRALASDDEGYVPIRNGQRLGGHDRLLLLPGARIELLLPQGCRQVLTGPAMPGVRTLQDCRGGAPGPDASTGAARFDGEAFLARTGGLGRIEAESRLDTVGP